MPFAIDGDSAVIAERMRKTLEESRRGYRSFASGKQLATAVVVHSSEVMTGPKWLFAF
jgi:hypothetical protein